MLSNNYEVYVSNIIKLCRSICIKSQQTIDAENSYLQRIGIDFSTIQVDQYKYYTNLRGEYWKASDIDSKYNKLTIGDDTLMYFTTLEDGSEIVLNKENLALYPLSRTELRTFNRYYNDLVDKYPTQDYLIRRILDPIDLTVNELIETADATILFYDTNLVEENEISLIPELQRWIFNYNDRWNVTAYQNSDRLYTGAWLALLYMHLTTTIEKIRFSKVKTNEVHSFHVWTYLGGFYELDKFKDKISKEQALFLYRNIEYISHTAGTKATLLFIYKGMIKDYGLFLNSFEIRQDSSELIESKANRIVINKYPFDASNIIEKRDNIISVENFIEKIKNQALLNERNQIIDVENLVNLSLHSTSPNMATGVIECEKERILRDGVVSVVEEKFRQWFYLAMEDKFQHLFNLTIFDNNSIAVTAKQAVYILLFCTERYNKFGESNLSTVLPKVSVIDLLNDPEKDYQDYIDEGFINSSFFPIEKYNVLTVSINNFIIPNLNVLTTISEFNDYVETVILEKVKHRLVVDSEIDIYGRIELQELIDGNFYDPYREYINTQSWIEFFNEIEYNLENLSKETLLGIIKRITEHFVGNVDVNEGMTSPHYEMMSILRILSSYLTMFVPSGASGIPIPLEWIENDVKVNDQINHYNFIIDVCPYVEFKNIILPPPE